MEAVACVPLTAQAEARTAPVVPRHRDVQNYQRDDPEFRYYRIAQPHKECKSFGKPGPVGRCDQVFPHLLHNHPELRLHHDLTEQKYGNRDEHSGGDLVVS
jgi:hypothetical protein